MTVWELVGRLSELVVSSEYACSPVWIPDQSVSRSTTPSSSPSRSCEMRGSSWNGPAVAIVVVASLIVCLAVSFNPSGRSTANPQITASGGTASGVWPGVNIETINQITTLQLTVCCSHLCTWNYSHRLFSVDLLRCTLNRSTLSKRCKPRVG